MITTKALHKSETDLVHPKSSKSDKWKTVLSQIWEKSNPPKNVKKTGKGFTNRVIAVGKGAAQERLKGAALHKKINVIYLPSDPNALFDRLDLLLASKHAGNTGLRNELV